MNPIEGKETAMQESSPVPARAKQDEETLSLCKRRGVEPEIWSGNMLAALDNGVKGGKWFSLIDKVYSMKTLEIAWGKVLSNKGSAGVDGVSVERFQDNSVHHLGKIQEALRADTYGFQPVRRVHIPKGDGKLRPLGIPSVSDRIVQTALKLVLEPIFENEFLDSSYGFRPCRGCKDALREVDRLLKAGYCHVVDADIRAYFDSIDHRILMDRVEEKISDGRVLALLHKCLEQPILEGLKCWNAGGGTPQGAVISPLLANIYLHPLDALLIRNRFNVVRYADDFVVLCTSRERAEEGLSLIQEWVKSNGLELHPQKTKVGDCRVEGEGFEFLGYRFESGNRWIRNKSLMSLKDKIRNHTRRTFGQSIKSSIENLNPILKGWFAYFKHANRRYFGSLDGFIRRRLRAILRKQDRRPGMGRTKADHMRWPNAYFANLGLFSLVHARECACRS